MNFGEQIKRFLRYPSLFALAHQDEVISTGRALVRFYYLTAPALSYYFLMSWFTPTDRPDFAPLWSMPWASFFDTDTVINIVRFCFLAASLLAVVWYRHRIVRLALFIALLEVHALESSFGSVDHHWYLWVLTSGILVFLPDSILNYDAPHDVRRRFLLVIWWAQAAVMLAYSVSGIWKVSVALEQFFQGTIHGFSMYAFAYQIADWLPKLQNEAPLASFIINHPSIAWPMYLGMHYMQLFAFWCMIRSSLQKLWAFELVLFHSATYLIMGIQFWQHLPLLLVLFFNSPFTRPDTTWKEIVFDLPVFGQMLEYAYALNKRTQTSDTSPQRA